MLNKPELNKPEKPAAASRRAPPAREEATARRPDGSSSAVMGTTLTRTAIRRDADAGEDRFRLIAERAYFRAEARGFTPGQELDDWLAAEVEVEEMLGQVEPRV